MQKVPYLLQMIVKNCHYKIGGYLSDVVCWAAGRYIRLVKTEWWGAGVVICLERGADLHMPT